MSEIKNTEELEEIEILDVFDEENEIKEPLKETIDDILKSTSIEMESHTEKILEYTRRNKSYQELQEKYTKLDLENKKNRLKLSEYEIELKQKEEENISLRKDVEKNKKKLVTVQSILQVVINSYGINSIIKVIGIPYVKLKEYLQD